MEANELRIGNLIQLYRKPQDSEKTIHSIKSLFFDDISKKYFAELEDGFKVNADKGIAPIPLTEEWLVKFGFEIDDYHKSKGNIDATFGMFNVYNQFNWDYFMYMPHCPSCDDDCGIQTDIKSVHQLQNLYFALTGKELEFINFDSKDEFDEWESLKRKPAE